MGIFLLESGEYPPLPNVLVLCTSPKNPLYPRFTQDFQESMQDIWGLHRTVGKRTRTVCVGGLVDIRAGFIGYLGNGNRLLDHALTHSLHRRIGTVLIPLNIYRPLACAAWGGRAVLTGRLGW